MCIITQRGPELELLCISFVNLFIIIYRLIQKKCSINLFYIIFQSNFCEFHSIGVLGFWGFGVLSNMSGFCIVCWGFV